MITFLDLIQRDDFRSFVETRIANHTDDAYSFPASLPKLYKYRSLSSHAIDDIINGKITLTAIGEFNDIFDGAMHQYGTAEERERATEEKWKEMEALRIAARIPESILRRESIVRPYAKRLKIESRLKFRELDLLGTYICCFSKNNASILMWAHYADENRGICVEYEFEKLPEGSLLRNSLFPVAYTNVPIGIGDLIEDKQHRVFQYSFDAAVLCSALNKAHMWNYEQEWRIVWVLYGSSENVCRLSINSLIRPSKVYLGYHFLKPFFYYDSKDKSESEKCESKIKKFVKLLSYLQANNISIAAMMPVIGSYLFKPYDISINDLFAFMLRHFDHNRPISVRYYYIIHDHFIDLIEKK